MENRNDALEQNSSSNNEPPTGEYLNQLQEEAMLKTKEEDATFGEQVIREGLQKWPDLIDEELRKFKEKLS